MASWLVRLSGKLRRASVGTEEEPIRGELFSVERLEQYARSLASEHGGATVRVKGRRLLPRLEENGRRLVSAYLALTNALRNEKSISPAAEWLVDNFHIVEEQLREIREDLPEGYYRELPKLTTGDFEGYPRIYAIAVRIIAHTDSRLDTDTLRRFVRAYQEVTPLTIGELWAVAITLRLALVENLRRLATRIVASRADREEADALADKLLEAAERQPESVVAQLAEHAARRGELGTAFVVQLTRRLREQDPAVLPVFEWLERRLQKQATGVEQVVHLEHQRQAAAQVTVGNVIASMRLLSTLDWRNFFESASLVEPILGRDPSGAYRGMDFLTRDRYRHHVERIAKRTRAPELRVAEYAAGLAEAAAREDADRPERAHVGFYLVGEGLTKLERAFSYRPTLRERLSRAVLARPTLFYLGTLAVLTALACGALLFYANRAGAGWPLLAAFALLSLVPASDLALAVLNWDVTHMFPPRLLPKMDTSAGLPEGARTFVVVPTLLTSEETAADLLSKLEVHYLANQDDELYFALLTDFGDADEAETDSDASILDAALARVEELNARHTGERAPRFHLFHRRRLWNASEGKWMGWERKRGKLEEFNRLLRGARDTSFIVSTADDALLSKVRFVVTLDSDTQLPRDSARKLVGVALHPLNHPRFDPRADRVARGYAILQPRVSISLESASRSPFARIFSGNTGIDPYTTAASDVYQDLFGEGSYTGKGLYVVDAFQHALEGRVPDNSVLSHDLFEGNYARCGLVSDVEFLDDYPARYDTYAMRQHRWTRGDWQIARWLLPRVPDAERRKVRNRLPVILRWKIFDNLRRSLVAPSIVLWLAFAWAFVPGRAEAWALFVLLVLAFPVYAHVTTSLLLHPRGVPWTSHFWGVWFDLRTNTKQVALTVVFLAHQAYLMTDAVARTLYRKLVSRRRLLEWTTAAQAESLRASTLSALARFMWPTGAIVLALAALVAAFRPAALLAAAPFLVAWALSPLIAHAVSRRLAPERKELSPEEAHRARLYARRTWRFFETFITAEENWLPPDNFQEDPKPVVAHRTSPTNVGLYLLSCVAARDFGYAGAHETVERLERTFDTLARLQKFRGHLFNWYDTRTLAPLAPLYVSTVDSGNLAGHLLALKQSCVELPDEPLFGAHTLRGLSDTVALMREESLRVGTFRQRTEAVTVRQLREEVEACARLLTAGAPETLSGWGALFDALARAAADIGDIADALAQEHGAEAFTELRFWIDATARQAEGFARDLRELSPGGASLDAHLSPLAHLFAPDTRARLRELSTELDRVASPAEAAERFDEAVAELSLLREAAARAEGRTSPAAQAAPSTASQPASSASTAAAASPAAGGEAFKALDLL
ncbi:MAG TPA: hypothetical protein VGV38_16970, partial [Pyrinomonadaceae bacterium]|nr:hypothetical protein [Pyrinomonadaceae bacterium]